MGYEVYSTWIAFFFIPSLLKKQQADRWEKVGFERFENVRAGNGMTGWYSCQWHLY